MQSLTALAWAGDFAASIDWGDTVTTAGTIVASEGGGFDVTGSHTYAHAGSKAITQDPPTAGGKGR